MPNRTFSLRLTQLLSKIQGKNPKFLSKIHPKTHLFLTEKKGKKGFALAKPSI